MVDLRRDSPAEAVQDQPSECRRDRSVDSSGATRMPPIMGVAMLLTRSDPAPLPIMTGSNPARVAATAIAIGRTRIGAPSRIASSNDTALISPATTRRS